MKGTLSLILNTLVAVLSYHSTSPSIRPLSVLTFYSTRARKKQSGFAGSCLKSRTQAKSQCQVKFRDKVTDEKFT